MTDDFNQDRDGESDAAGRGDNVHRRMTSLLKTLRPTRWKIFHNPHLVTDFKHEYKTFPYHEREQKCQPIIDIAPWDVLIFDQDYSPRYEMKNHPQLLIVQATKPLAQIEKQFQSFLKQCVPEMPHIDNTQQLADLGYQIRLEPKLGVIALRLPNPEHMLRFTSQLADQQLINMLSHELTYQFARALKARYDQELHLRPAAEPQSEHDNEYQLRQDYQQQQTLEQQRKFRYQPKPTPKSKKWDND